jgi:hypothetical protein
MYNHNEDKQVRILNRYCFDYFLYLSFLLTVLVLQPAIGSAENNPQASPAQSGQAASLMAGLSDEQVRQMLIAELQSDAMEDQYSKQEEMAGPAGMFYRLLSKFSGEHDDNEEQVKKLWSGIPNVIPDLHKAFLTL